MSDTPQTISAVKGIANMLAMLVVWPAGVMCWLEKRLFSEAEGVFGFWTHVFAQLPGHPGLYLRRAFYCLTLEQCALKSYIGFGTLFSHRWARVEEDVYIGPYAVIGSVLLRRGCLIGTRASLLSGAGQHEQSADGRWTPSEVTRFKEIEIGEHAWIGEAATIMADVGAGSVVAAGAVVSAAVPASVVVAGNPARFVRQVKSEAAPAVPLVAEAGPRRREAYAPWIDWLKCLGMLAILYGHLAGWAPVASLPPIYTKQIGVAFFLFITAFTLAGEPRDPWRVAFSRLFEPWFFGLLLAVGLTVTSLASHGGPLLSNYGPLAGGINVLFNSFPANPTTWYLGTYLHVLMVWAVLVRRVRVSLLLVAVACVAEIAVRALLIHFAGRFVAYMLLTNWMSVFLLGFWLGQHRQRAVPAPRTTGAAAVVLVASVAGWAAIARQLPFEHTFPLMRLSAATPGAAAIVNSAVVSVLYLGVTWLTFLTVATWAAPRLVQFVARNTLVIFLGHMPVLYAISPILAKLQGGPFARSAIMFVVSIAGLGLLSELLRRLLGLRVLRDRLLARLSGQPAAAQWGDQIHLRQR
jgi:acetyltransferase-like isoleucine patch superfamily enzyme